MTYTNEELLEMFQSDFSNSKKDVSSKTVDIYTANIKYLLTFLNNKPILDIKEDDILNYMESVNANISKSTYNNRVFSFRTLFNVLRVNRKLKDLNINNPANDVETYRKVDNKRKTELSLVEQSMLIKYSKDAREKAIADAKKQAKVLAKQLHVRLVTIISFNENGDGAYPVYMSARADSAMMAGKAATPEASIAAGEQTITSNVSITYKIR